MDSPDQAGLTKKERRALRREQRHQEKTPNSGRSLLLWGGVIAVVVVAMVWLFRQGSAPKPETSSVTGQEVTADDWVKGPADAKVTLIEYSDLQCPACASYYPLVKDLGKAFPKDLRIVYRHFPLRQIHTNAQLAAQAAEAAGIQSRFWEYHDILFERQRDWAIEDDPRELFYKYAKELKLDEEKFKTDIDSEAVKQAIDLDIKQGMQARVNATPSFILNGQKIVNPRSLEEFKQLIEKARQ